MVKIGDKKGENFYEKSIDKPAVLLYNLCKVICFTLFCESEAIFRG